jgi:replicative DNA helicase
MSAPRDERVVQLDAVVAEGLEANVRRWLRLVGVKHGDWIETQAIEVPEARGFRTVTRFAHAGDAETLIRLLAEADRWEAPGIYVIANRVNPAVATRKPAGQWHNAQPRESTTDRDIEARTVFYVDVDVERPSRTSASDPELALADATAVRIYDDLAVALEGTDALALGHSGNGRSIFVALDHPAETKELRSLVSGLLAAIKALYDGDGIKIDTSVADAKRLVPAFGTMKRKGSGQPPRPGEPLLRPHRRTGILVPEQVKRVDQAALERLLDVLRSRLDEAQNAEVDRAMGKKPTPASKATSGRRDRRLNPFDEAKQVPVASVLAWLDLVGPNGPICPGCGTTGDSSVAVVENGLKCLHARCAERGVRGRPGFRTTVDLVVEAQHLEPREAVNLMAEQFGFNGLRAAATGVAAPVDPAEDWDRGGSVGPYQGPTEGPSASRQAEAHQMPVGRPPRDLVAERALLAATLQNRGALEAIAPLVLPEHFYALEGALIWGAELELLAAGKPVDHVTVTSQLRSHGQLERVGGGATLQDLVGDLPDVAHVEAYAAIVRATAKHRTALALLQRLASEARGDVSDVDVWLDSVEETIHAVVLDRAGQERLPTLRETLLEVFRELDSPDRDPGVRTGLVDLDALMGPMLPGQVCVIAAASGIGKTSLGMQWAVHAAREQILARLGGKSQVIHQAVLAFSLEMRRDELAMRALFSEARVDGSKAVNTKRLSKKEWSDLAEAAKSVALPNVYIEDRGGLTPLDPDLAGPPSR